MNESTVDIYLKRLYMTKHMHTQFLFHFMLDPCKRYTLSLSRLHRVGLTQMTADA